MRPLIGLVCSMDAKEEKFHVKNAYVEAIEKNNGIPILLPPMKNFNLEELGFLDGIFLIGGNDINPLFLGEEPSLYMGETSPIRDVFEFAMLEWAIKNNIPILGICRGMQVMGGFNGKLIQDINSEVKESICHSQKSFVNIYTHTVTVDENSKLSKVLGTTKIITNSFHHQSVKECGKYFKPVGFAKDGVIEAIEGKNNSFAIGVQWHPEYLFKDSEEHNNLFKEFVKEAKEYRRSKKC